MRATFPITFFIILQLLCLSCGLISKDTDLKKEEIGSISVELGPEVLKESHENLSKEQEEHLELYLKKIDTKNKIIPELWFDIPSLFLPYFYKKHPFFDQDPRFQLTSKMVDYVLLIPPYSKAHYQLDLPTGIVYKTHSYCAVEDVWKRPLSIDGPPPYAQGFIPRALDSQGAPLKIYIFGKMREMETFSYDDLPTLSARIIGGAIEQYCEFLPCLSGSGWTSRPVLLAVSPDDSALADVHSLKELKTIMNWETLLGYIENIQGHITEGDRLYATYRLVNEMSADKILQIAFSEKNILSKKEWKGVQKGCFRLYKWIWDNLGDGDKLLKETVLKVKDEIYWKKNKDQIPENDRLELLEHFKSDYALKMSYFFKNYIEDAKRCANYVYFGNALEQDDKFWFLTFFVGMLRYLDSNFLFDCGQGQWVRTFHKADAEKIYQNFLSCNYEKLQKMFTTMPLIKENHKYQKIPYYQFLEYNLGHMGTHRPLYNWIKRLPDELACLERYSLIQDRQQDIVPSFPEDVKWKDILPFQRKE